MTPHTIKPAARDDDSKAREQRIRSRILNGIEETLDELAQPRELRAAIERALQARCAVLLCRQALCRRVKRCRREPCTVPPASFARSDS